MAPPKKVDPYAKPPSKIMPFVAGGMLILGFGWFVFKMNPGGLIRAEYPEEKKEREAHEREVAAKKKEEERRELRLKKRMGQAH